MQSVAINYVVKRRSPDWQNFDLEETRAFLVSLDLPENMIINFAKLWDKQIKISYTKFRQIMKEIALENIKSIPECTILGIDDIRDCKFTKNDLIYFTDDDDWASPNIFIRLRDNGDLNDGFRWNSIRVGTMSSDTPNHTAHASAVFERPTSRIINTNSYAVSGAAWTRLGADGLLEHYDAQRMFDSGLFQPRHVDEYLTATNKHPCSTVVIRWNSESAIYLDNLRADLRTQIARLKHAELSSNSAWLAPWLDRLCRVLSQAAGDFHLEQKM